MCVVIIDCCVVDLGWICVLLLVGDVVWWCDVVWIVWGCVCGVWCVVSDVCVVCCVDLFGLYLDWDCVG